MYLHLGTDLKADALCGGLGVIDGLCTSLNIRAYTVVVARSECAQVTETVKSDSVLWRAEANSSVVSGDLSLCDVVGSLSAEEESITADDGISSEGWALT